MNEIPSTIKAEIKVKLYPDDLAKLAKELANAVQEANSIEQKRKAYNKDLAAEVESWEQIRDALSLKINLGYELKEMDCMWIMSTPGPGQKTLVRADTNEEIRVEAMTQADSQLGMDLQPPSEDTSAEAGGGEA